MHVINTQVPSYATCLVISSDTQGATYLDSSLFYACDKCIEVDYHFIQEQVLVKNWIVVFISTKDRLANGLTKSVPWLHFIQTNS